MLSGSVARVGNAISIGTSSRMVTECLLESSSFFMMDSSSSEVVTCCSSWTQHVSMYWSLCKHKLLCSLQAELEPTNVAMKSQEHKDHTNTTWKKNPTCEDPSTILLIMHLKKKAHLFHDGFRFLILLLNVKRPKKFQTQVRQVLALPSSQGTKAEGSGYWDPKRTKLACFVHGETRNWRVNGENCLKIYTHFWSWRFWRLCDHFQN